MNEREIQEVRDFNRFYTNIIGLLDNSVYNTSYTLPEARVLYEIFHRQPCTAKALTENIKIDKAYLSRILTSFSNNGMLTKKQSPVDGRATLLSLTTKGNRQFETINKASIKEIQKLLTPLSATERIQLLKHMDGIRAILKKTQHHE